MVGSTAGDIASSNPPDTVLAPFPIEPVDVARLVVPLDGSPFAERALPVANWVASAVGADVQLVEVVASDDDEGAEGAIRYLDSASRQGNAPSWDIVHRDDVASGARRRRRGFAATDGLPGDARLGPQRRHWRGGGVAA